MSPFAPDNHRDRAGTGDGRNFTPGRPPHRANRRKAFEWEELRGLLILRFEIEKIMSSSLACLPRGKLFRLPKTIIARGFAAHADGLDVAQLMDDSRP